MNNFTETKVYYHTCPECGKGLPPALPNSELGCYSCNSWSTFKDGKLISTKSFSAR